MRNSQSRRCPNIFCIDGDHGRLDIIRKNGDIISAIFDLKYFDELQKYHWQYTNAGYVRTIKSHGNIFMHRMIMELEGVCVDGMQVDHINGHQLDCRSQNLRACSSQENCRNTRWRALTGSGVVGVRRDTRCINSWRTQIYIDKQHHIERTFKDKELAIEQRLKWEIEFFGEFAPQIELIKSDYPHLLQTKEIHIQ